MCNMWFEEFREKLDRWIDEHPVCDTNTKIDIYILPKNKVKTCKKCNQKTLAEHLLLTYYKGNATYEKSFHIRRCENCNLIFMSENTYKMYINSSDMQDQNVRFIFE